MRPARLILVALIVATLAGCASVSPAQLAQVEQDRQAAVALLTGFQQAMLAKDPGRLRPLLAPGITPTQFLPLALKLEAASWLKSYAGYTLEAQEAVRRVSARRWAGGRVQLKAVAVNADGDRFRNRFFLARGRDGWYIKDFVVDQPEPGDPVDPPAAIREQMRPAAREVMKALREGRITDIYYLYLPDDPTARYRTPVLSFWQKLSLSEPAGPIGIFDDLSIVKQLNIAAWPDTSQPLEFTWLSSGAVSAVYEVPYIWTAPTEPETLRIELVFVRRGSDWTFFMLRFHGAAIPYSE